MDQSAYQEDRNRCRVPPAFSTPKQVQFVCEISNAGIPHLPETMKAGLQPTFQEATFHEDQVVDMISETAQLQILLVITNIS